MKKNNLFLLLFFIFLFIYEELIFHIFVFKNFTMNFLYVILFSIPVGGIFYILSNLFKNKLNRIPTYFFTGLTLFLFIANFIYNKVYISIISIYSLLNGNQVLGFLNHILKIAKENWYVLVLMLLPLIVLIVLDVLKKVNYERTSPLAKVSVLLGVVLIQLLALTGIKFIDTDEIYSNKNLYSSIHSPLLTTERLGLVTMFRLDCQRTIFGFTEKDIEVEVPDTDSLIDKKDEEEEKPKEIKYNTSNIDWESLINNEQDEKIKSMHKYFSVQSATNQNDYTGMFKGKNLIVFVAEAFSPMAINEELTPNI